MKFAGTENVRNFLKRTPLLFRLNAWRRAREIEHEARALRCHYEREAERLAIVYSRDWAVARLRERLAVRSISPRRFERRPNVFWVGTEWNQDHSGFVQALARVSNVHECRTGDQYGLLLRLANGRRDDDVVKRNDVALLAKVRDLHASVGIDLFLGQMWANFVSPSTLHEVRMMGIPVVNIALDDRLPEHWRRDRGIFLGAAGLACEVDITLTTAAECCLWYAVEGAPALFWPMASEPEMFRPAPEETRRHEISFIGSRYGVREKIVSALLREGLPVEPFGPGWPNGAVDAETAAEIFGHSKIVLGIGNVGYSERIYTLKLRDFDAPMSGALYVTHRNPDLLTLFREGEEIECYSSIAECVRKLRQYLADPERRRRVAAAGAVRARSEHTWDRRFGDLFDLMDFELPTAASAVRSMEDLRVHS